MNEIDGIELLSQPWICEYLNTEKYLLKFKNRFGTATLRRMGDDASNIRHQPNQEKHAAKMSIKDNKRKTAINY